MSREIAPEILLAAAPLFKSLDAATLAHLVTTYKRRALKRGETLFRKGDPATGMYIVVYGEIKLIATTPTRGRRLSGVVGRALLWRISAATGRNRSSLLCLHPRPRSLHSCI